MQPRFFALFALAFLAYVVASLGAAGVKLELGAASLTLVAGLSALAPVWVRARGEHEATEAGQRVAILGVALSVALSARLSLHTRTLLGELLCALAFPAVGLIVLSLACVLPDRPRLLTRQRWLLPAAAVLTAAGALSGMVAAAPPFWLHGRSVIAAHSWSLGPLLVLCSCLLLALVLRLLRRLLGSEARALAANLWATVGTGTALALIALLLWLGPSAISREPLLHGLLALASAACLLGHLFMVTPLRVERAGSGLRSLLSVTLAVALASVLGLQLARSSQLPALLTGVVVLLSFVALRALFDRLIERTLKPNRGLLLAALREVQREAYGALDFEDFLARVLKPLRRAAGLPEASPLLALLDPPRTAQLDAAGYARVSDRALARAIVERLQQRPGEPIVRSDLSGSLVRRPELAALVRALDELDALCVLPLRSSGELDGALVLARGNRRAPLTLEELLALEALAQTLSPIVAAFLSLARMRARAERAEAAQRELSGRVEEQGHELRELRAQVSAVKAGLGLPLPTRDAVQYSPAMHALRERLTSVAPSDLPVLLWGETGLNFAPIAQSIHRASGRANEPFVIIDGGALAGEAARAALFGTSAHGRAKPGLLELMERGTLLVNELPALAPELQRALAETLEERCVRPLHGNVSAPFAGRIIATAHNSVAELAAKRAVVPELLRWFEGTCHRLPPLRERREDLESSLLLALDRAARVLGVRVKGLEANALRMLLEYDWPGNDEELISVIERGYLRANEPRLKVSDLPLLPLGLGTVSGRSYEEQEREILLRALRQAGGDRIRAARTLGMKRSLFNEKLKKYLGAEARRPER